jgi:hypothetical protein
MKQTASVLREIIDEMKTVLAFPDPREPGINSEARRQRETGREEKKQYWEQRFAQTYRVIPGLCEIPSMFFPKL